MSYAESVMDEIKSEEQSTPEVTQAEASKPEETSATSEWSNEPPKDWSKPDEKTEPSEDKPSAEQPTETEAESETEPPKPEEVPPAVEKQPKPDLSKLTKEEKASHAFQRQLAKQKEKHKAEMEAQREELRKEFQSQIDEIKKSVAKEEPVKTRNDFETDDEYIGYLTQRGVDQRMAQIDADNAKAKAEADAKAKADAEVAEQQKQMADYFNTNAKQTFGEGYAEFEKTVQKGVANGLADVLDEAPSVRDYIFSNPNGPAVLNEMLLNKESFVRVMRLAANPMDAVIECHELAREIASRKAEPAPAPTPKMPSLGKPGAGGSTRTAPDMYHDDASLIDFVRRHR